jgi:hypothetical protein
VYKFSFFLSLSLSLSLQGNNRLRLLEERMLKGESGYRKTEIVGNLNHT